MEYGKRRINIMLEDVTVDGSATLTTMVSIGNWEERVDIDDDATIENANVSDEITVENLVDQIHGEDMFEEVLGHIHEKQTYFTPDLGKFRVVTLKEWDKLNPVACTKAVPLTPIAEDQSNKNLIVHMRGILKSFDELTGLPNQLEQSKTLMRLATMLHCSLDIGSTNEGGE